MDTIARSFSTLYIWIDLAWLAFFAVLLAVSGRRRALVVGLLGGVLYFIVDYGIFHLLLKTRVVAGADPFWFLLWLSFSYGLTNMAWMWLMLERDREWFGWSALIVCAWLSTALLSQNFGAGFPSVACSRSGATYHGVMGLVMLAGYAALLARNLFSDRTGLPRAPIARLVAIGICAQLGWEASLLVTGIRPMGWNVLVLNSLVETNLGAPYLFLIHEAVSKRGRKL